MLGFRQVDGGTGDQSDLAITLAAESVWATAIIAICLAPALSLFQSMVTLPPSLFNGHFAALPQVAVKRIANVLSSPEQAKRVLREICILRRLTHPFIIELKDAFVRPSATG